MATENQQDAVLEILARVKEIQVKNEEGRQNKTPDPIPLIDPTANVLALVKAETKRQDDLRAAEGLRLDQLRIQAENCAKEISAVQLKAQEDLVAAESRRIDALTVAESRRIDALLSAAANAVTLASTRAELTASALAERVDTSAKTLAQAVVASAEALRVQVVTTQQAIDARVTRLEQSGFTIGGRDTQRDLERGESRQGGQWGMSFVVAVISAIFGFLGITAAIIFGVLRATGH
jgi:hypothetical protein